MLLKHGKTSFTSHGMRQKKYTMLCLGDSYTIGEAVQEHERFPVQTVEILKANGVHFEAPHLIAKTGWTTDELMQAIAAQNHAGNFDVVTLLIGVNNQYRGRDLENYRTEFRALLQTALQYAAGNSNHVFVVSIPDWGVTPFIAQDAKHRSRQQVALEIDAFNKVNKEVAEELKVHYIDITPYSRQALWQKELIAGDGLHPSGKMYKHWANELAAGILKHVVND